MNAAEDQLAKEISEMTDEEVERNVKKFFFNPLQTREENQRDGRGGGMNHEQKKYLDREIKRCVKRCRRGMRGNARAFEIQQAILETLWEVRQELRRLEVGNG